MEMTTAQWEAGEDAFPSEKANLTGDKRTEARLCAVQALFQSRTMGLHPADVAEEFTRTRLPTRTADKKLFALVMDEASSGQDRYMAMISAHLLDNWSLDRLDPVQIALLWAALAELAANADAPTKVVFNEYLNISKGFMGEKEVGYINRVLDAAGKKIRGE